MEITLMDYYNYSNYSRSKKPQNRHNNCKKVTNDNIFWFCF